MTVILFGVGSLFNRSTESIHSKANGKNCHRHEMLFNDLRLKPFRKILLILVNPFRIPSVTFSFPELKTRGYSWLTLFKGHLETGSNQHSL